MNTTQKENSDSHSIIQWFRRHNYPHCKVINSLASLRSGVAIAEILTEKLPKAYHSLFLPNIEIYNLNPQRAMMNLNIMLNTLKTFLADDHQSGICIDDFTAEGLFFDHNMMQNFILTVLLPLKATRQEESDHKINIKQNYRGLQDVSDIANLSSIIAHHQPKMQNQQKILIKSKVNDQQKHMEIDKEQLRIEGICDWLEQHHHIVVEDSTPEEIMGQLVNSTFTGSRLDKEKVIKQCHYELGSASVFKKVGDYLLTCQRMPKHNVLAMMQEVEYGCMREQLFWNIVEDIMNIKMSHQKKMRKRSTKKVIDRINTKRTNSPSNKQNICIDPKKQVKKEVINKQLEIYQFNLQTLRLAESWIRNQLGYEHSLNKGKNIANKQQNPVLNGNLLGSIVMRMQLGKVNIIKQPRNKKQIDRNMGQVTSCILRRGIEAARKFAKAKPSYENYLCIMWQVKTEFQRKNSQQKVRRAQMQKERELLHKKVSIEQKQRIILWLQEKGYDINNLQQVSSSVVSEVCGELLQLRLFRQTTKRIRQNNIQKILNELRHLGWEGEGDYTAVMKDQNQQIRWSMLNFALQIVKHKVYFCK